MKFKKILLLLIPIFLFVACEDTPSEPVEETFSIVWQDDLGVVLEEDTAVLKGSIPSFDGVEPSKESASGIRYVFIGWSPSVKPVSENTTYTAVFKEIDETILGSTPIYNSEHNTIEYGLYPQSYVSDDELIKELDLLTNANSNGWYFYNGSFYVKEIAALYNNESYTFEDGTLIENGKSYWFLCETIKWQVLKTDDNYYLTSSKLLDTHAYNNDYLSRNIDNETVYSNNFYHSEIRRWLNDEFYKSAFILNDLYLVKQSIDNSSKTTDNLDNLYESKDSNDFISLLSFEDLNNSLFGFNDSSFELPLSRQCKTTDYARARGAWCNTRTDLGTEGLYNGIYLTRSPSSKNYYSCWNVNSGGVLSSYTVDGADHCIRPCILIKTIN